MQTTTEAPLRIRNGQNQLVMQMLQQRVTLLVSTKLASELVKSKNEILKQKNN